MVDWVKLGLRTAGAVGAPGAAHPAGAAGRQWHLAKSHATYMHGRHGCCRLFYSPHLPTPLLQLGGLVGLAVSLLYFLQEKIVSAGRHMHCTAV